VYLGFDQIEEDLRDTNKERNLKSTDPVFCNKFKNEWDEITKKLRESCKKSENKTNENERKVMRYSANGIEFR
jgi:DNA-directed RNA polymerase beta subunit